MKCYSAWDYCNEELHKFLDLRQKGIILDLGSGDGGRSKFFREQGFNVIAVDIDKKRFFCDNYNSIECLVCDAQYLPFKCNVFDTILCVEILEHLEQPERCVKEVFSVLKNGKKVLWTTPCLNMPILRNIITSLYRKLIRRTAEEHKWVFSDNHLLTMLQKHFSIVRIKYSRHMIVLTILFGIYGHFFDEKFQKLPLPLLRIFAQGIVVLCGKWIKHTKCYNINKIVSKYKVKVYE